MDEQPVIYLSSELYLAATLNARHPCVLICVIIKNKKKQVAKGYVVHKII